MLLFIFWCDALISSDHVSCQIPCWLSSWDLCGCFMLPSAAIRVSRSYRLKCLEGNSFCSPPPVFLSSSLMCSLLLALLHFSHWKRVQVNKTNCHLFPCFCSQLVDKESKHEERQKRKWGWDKWRWNQITIYFMYPFLLLVLELV